MKALIESAKGRFISVEFVKADGTNRRMTIQPAGLKNHLKGEAGAEKGHKTANTKAALYPNLYPVYEVGQRIKSINLDTVFKITIDKKTYNFSK